MMRADACFHADHARLHVGKPRFDLAARPLLPQHDRTALILANEVKRVLADIDADQFGAPLPASLASGARSRPDHPIAGHTLRRIRESVRTRAGRSSATSAQAIDFSGQGGNHAAVRNTPK
jgi:hypothetical protein